MASNKERRSLPLQKQEWAQLEDLAKEFNTIPPKGKSDGSPSWRTLVKEIAKGNLIITESHTVIEIKVDG